MMFQFKEAGLTAAVNDKWNLCVAHLYYAFQPIVNIHSGVVFGYEALIRGWETAGFSSINDLFEQAEDDKILYTLDLHLRRMAVKKMMEICPKEPVRLFFNVDSKVLEMPDYNSGNTEVILDEFGFPRNNMHIEISEKHEFNSYEETCKILNRYKERGFHIVLDDFGSGYSGLTLLYHSEPDAIKIDRFFIANINSDNRKKFFVSSIVKMAHMMGILVIAEGVETREEFYAVREIGCDYVQGFLIQKAEFDNTKILKRYPIISELVAADARQDNGDRRELIRKILRIPGINHKTSTEKVLEIFRVDHSFAFFPVLNDTDEPIGILRERDLKKYVYSPYGISILQHKSVNSGIRSMLTHAPIIEITTRLNDIVDLYGINQETEGIILTENGKYLGVLDSKAILQILSEKQISAAQDQNPLTRLPGNTGINRFLSRLLKEKCAEFCCVYFDFNNFKPFNDAYGFRQGDRLILLFADILREYRRIPISFVGHIGGDDFFAIFSMQTVSEQQILDEVTLILTQFAESVVPFYSQEDRKLGYLLGKDRSGRKRRFPMLTTAAAVLFIKPESGIQTVEDISAYAAKGKKTAKNNANSISVSHL